jgi:hypothetical protein
MLKSLSAQWKSNNFAMRKNKTEYETNIDDMPLFGRRPCRCADILDDAAVHAIRRGAQP